MVDKSAVVNYSDEVLYEQIKVVLKAGYFILITYAITAIAFVMIMKNVVSHSMLFAWSVIFFVILLVRAAIHYRIQNKVRVENARLFGYYIMGSLGITGLVWGLGVMLMFPGLEIGYQFFIMFIVAGIGGSAFSSNTIYLPGLYVFFPALLLPLALRMLMMDGELYLMMGTVTLVFMISLFYFSKNLNHSLVETLMLRFENSELVSQLKIQKEEAEYANNAKSKFLAAASHDLRQPLHALTLFTSVLNEYVNTPKVREVVAQIESSVNALQYLFNALLDVSRLDAGAMKFEKIQFDLAEMFVKLRNDFEPLANNKGLRIIWPKISFVVYSDPVLLERIIRNYISNAINYTLCGEIEISCENVGNKVSVKVKDSGVGIPKEQQKSIYDEFHQLGNAERDREKGLGLGLAIVKRTAKLLDHTINVRSELGKGSEFSVDVDAGLSKNISKKPEPEYVEIEMPGRGDALVVVIDDEVNIREGMKELLELWGYIVITAASEEEAVSLLEKQKGIPIGIVADYRLRDNKTGVEAIGLIRSMYKREIPSLIVTGEIAVEHLRNIHDNGLQILHKPVAAAKLRAFLRSVPLPKT